MKGKIKDIDSIIGFNLYYIRQLKRLRIKELSKQIGVSYQQFRKYELGKNRISAGSLYELSKILDIPIENFFKPITTLKKCVAAFKKNKTVLESTLFEVQKQME